MTHDDDRQVGRILSRREALALLGAAGVVLLPGCSSGDEAGVGSPSTVAGGGTAPGPATTGPGTTGPGTTGPATTGSGGGSGTAPPPVAVPTCVVRPQATEGPFFVDERLQRSDLRADPSGGAASPGTPLALTFRCARLDGSSCTALPGATVDVWHCDAAGRYSGVASEGTRDQKFLRGFQTTAADGTAAFTTVFPGWYQGRAIHIHFKIRAAGREFTSQLFFDDAVAARILAQPPYATRGPSPMPNSVDGIYRRAGSDLLVTPTPQGPGFAATFDIGLQF